MSGPAAPLCCLYADVSGATGLLWAPAACGLHVQACPGSLGDVTRECTINGWADDEDTSTCLHLTLANIVQNLLKADSITLQTVLEFLEQARALVLKPAALGSIDWENIIFGSSHIAANVGGLSPADHHRFLDVLDGLLTATAADTVNAGAINATATLRATLLDAFDAACADALTYSNGTFDHTTVLFAHRTQHIVLECHIVALNQDGDVLWQPSYPTAEPFLRLPSHFLSDLHTHVRRYSASSSAFSTSFRSYSRSSSNSLASGTSPSGVTSVLLQLTSLPSSAFISRRVNTSLPVLGVKVPGLASDFTRGDGVAFKVTGQAAAQPARAVCAWWSEDKWSTLGCDTTIDIDNTILCNCESLGMYGVLATSNVEVHAQVDASTNDALVPDLWTFVFLSLALVMNISVLAAFLFVRKYSDSPRRFIAVQVTISQLVLTIAVLAAITKAFNGACSFFGPAVLCAFFTQFVWQVVALRFVYIVGGLRSNGSAPSSTSMLTTGWGPGLLLLIIFVAIEYGTGGSVDQSIGDHVCWLKGSLVLGLAHLPTTIVLVTCLGFLVAMWLLDGTLYDPARNLTSLKPSIWPSFAYFCLTTLTWVTMLWAFEAQQENALTLMAFIWLLTSVFFTVMQLTVAKNELTQHKDVEFVSVSHEREMRRSQKLAALESRADQVYRQQLVREAVRERYLGVHNYSRADLFACIYMQVG
ncbi:hypothetical protein PTSG_02116 [Salpingoeca rosetta]|uniref:GPS domain-containing protein n=1 Tax=Salpingoeca rosetta (strain ATCC 50818 / BSB-021) TaxID=946362 RepID=F2U194_SALR5|nr:uncharacterized protein PTSG_02116 [Salpingoeca rosetta]EGD81396.1 hypothetical protein PTSG_02116 [Salpingoeca rosetta]|eukprot:XP_004996600.1 hypothetical protein PTSG_02116 [Salpingoeca rosetta]